MLDHSLLAAASGAPIALFLLVILVSELNALTILCLRAAAKIARIQRSLALENTGYTGCTISNSEDVSDAVSDFNVSNAGEAVSLFKVSAGCLSLRLRRL